MNRTKLLLQFEIEVSLLESTENTFTQIIFELELRSIKEI